MSGLEIGLIAAVVVLGIVGMFLLSLCYLRKREVKELNEWRNEDSNNIDSLSKDLYEVKLNLKEKDFLLEQLASKLKKIKEDAESGKKWVTTVAFKDSKGEDVEEFFDADLVNYNDHDNTYSFMNGDKEIGSIKYDPFVFHKSELVDIDKKEE